MLTLRDKEILCQLNCADNQLALDEQKLFAAELARAYEFGNEEVPLDKWKSYKYKLQAGDLDAKPPGPEFLRIKTFFLAYYYYNDIRLKLISAQTISGVAGIKFLPKYFGIAGFFYLLRLLVDVGVIAVSTFRPAETEEDKNTPFIKRSWRRLQNVLFKGARLSRMINDGVWGPLNVICFFVSPPIAMALTLAGFLIDCAQSLASFYREKTPIQETIGKLEKSLAETTDIHERSKLTHELAQLNKLATETKYSNAFMIFTTVMILVGCTLAFFPPTAPAGALLLGSGMMMNLVPVIYKGCQSLWRKLTHADDKEVSGTALEKQPLLTPVEAQIEEVPKESPNFEESVRRTIWNKQIKKRSKISPLFNNDALFDQTHKAKLPKYEIKYHIPSIGHSSANMEQLLDKEETQPSNVFSKSSCEKILAALGGAQESKPTTENSSKISDKDNNKVAPPIKDTIASAPNTQSSGSTSSSFSVDSIPRVTLPHSSPWLEKKLEQSNTDQFASDLFSGGKEEEVETHTTNNLQSSPSLIKSR